MLENFTDKKLVLKHIQQFKKNFRFIGSLHRQSYRNLLVKKQAKKLIKQNEPSILGTTHVLTQFKLLYSVNPSKSNRLVKLILDSTLFYCCDSIGARIQGKRNPIFIFSYYLITLISYDQKNIFYCISFH